MTVVGMQAFDVASDSDFKVEAVMDSLKQAVTDYNVANDTEQSKGMALQETDKTDGVIGKLGLLGVDISSGGGALLLDHTLQGLSTQATAAAQIAAKESALKKEVKQAGQ
ncbi:MAG: hypothetical protein NT099_00455 [Candidatus Saganbacteria bacterium]|nr:hypothetical protein [Candidatus Saganbacteria bacterium]